MNRRLQKKIEQFTKNCSDRNNGVGPLPAPVPLPAPPKKVSPPRFSIPVIDWPKIGRNIGIGVGVVVGVVTIIVTGPKIVPQPGLGGGVMTCPCSPNGIPDRSRA
jgi:hypothetical protein